MTANAVHLQPDVQPDEAVAESADFILDAEEVAKGRCAVESYLASLRSVEARGVAEEGLNSLALLFTDGLCNAYEFPWQQLRTYHVAAGLAMLKPEGVPARIEAMRLGREPGGKCRQAPANFTSKEIRGLRGRLNRVLRKCQTLGFLTEEQLERTVNLPKVNGKRPVRGRALSDGEYRALIAACNADLSSEGARDALMFCLAYQAGLQLVELAAISLDDLGYDAKQDRVTVRIKAGKKAQGRTIPLHNSALIALEDWLEWRGRNDGPLLCPAGRGGTIEMQRLTAAAVRQYCGKRADEAGLEAFFLNDLARSVSSPRLVKKARSNKGSSGGSGKAWSPGASALYSEAAAIAGEDQSEAEHPLGRRTKAVRFPYLRRTHEPS